MDPKISGRVETLAQSITNPPPNAWQSYMDTPQYHPLTLGKEVYEANLPSGITPDIVRKLAAYNEDFKAAVVLATGRMFVRNYTPGQAEYIPREMYEVATTTENIVCHFIPNKIDATDVSIALGETSSIERLQTPEKDVPAKLTMNEIRNLFLSQHVRAGQ